MDTTAHPWSSTSLIAVDTLAVTVVAATTVIVEADMITLAAADMTTIAAAAQEIIVMAVQIIAATASRTADAADVLQILTLVIIIPVPPELLFIAAHLQNQLPDVHIQLAMAVPLQ